MVQQNKAFVAKAKTSTKDTGYEDKYSRDKSARKTEGRQQQNRPGIVKLSQQATWLSMRLIQSQRMTRSH